MLALTAPVSAKPWIYPDAYTYAEMGRQVARGDGFSTLQAHPYVLTWLREHGSSLEPPWPNVTRFPLIALIYGGAFRLFGATQATVQGVGGAFFIATVATTFLLGARLFGTLGGVLAALAVSINATQLGLSRLGLLESGAGFFLVASMLALLATLDSAAGTGERRRIAAPLCLGVSSGLAFLLRYDLLPFAAAAGVVLLVGRGGVGRRQLPWMVLGFALPVAPWVCRNLVSFGSPVAFLGIDRNVLWRPGTEDVYLSMKHGGLWAVLAEKPEIVLDKLRDYYWPFILWRNIFGWSTTWLGPSFIAAGAYLMLRRHRALRLWLALVLTFLLRTLILTLTHHELRFYQSYAPLLFVFALGSASEILVSRPRAPWWLRGVGVVVIVALLVVPAVRGTAFMVSRRRRSGLAPTATQGLPSGSSKPSAQQELLEAIRRRMPDSAVIATIWTEEVAWYGERPAIYLQADQIGPVEKMGVRVLGLLYPGESTQLVLKALRRQGLGDQFVPVARTQLAILWVHRKLLRSWLATSEAGAP